MCRPGGLRYRGGNYSGADSSHPSWAAGLRSAFADPLSWDVRGRVSAKADTQHAGPREVTVLPHPSPSGFAATPSLHFGFLSVAPLRRPLAVSAAPKRRLFFVAAAKPPQRKIFSFCSFGLAGGGFWKFSRPCSEKGQTSGKGGAAAGGRGGVRKPESLPREDDFNRLNSYRGIPLPASFMALAQGSPGRWLSYPGKSVICWCLRASGGKKRGLGQLAVASTLFFQYALGERKMLTSVRRRILMSSRSDQFSMYQRSYLVRSAMDVSPRRPFTCAQPVIPAFSRCRSI